MVGLITRESDKFMLRLPDGMRERIKRSAEGSRRSMNAEIVDMIEDGLARVEYLEVQSASGIDTEPTPSADIEQIVAEMTALYEHQIRAALYRVRDSKD